MFELKVFFQMMKNYLRVAFLIYLNDVYGMKNANVTFRKRSQRRVTCLNRMMTTKFWIPTPDSMTKTKSSTSRTEWTSRKPRTHPKRKAKANPRVI